MMSVDVIGNTRRAYFEQRLLIKEIVRTLCVSRVAFKYERGVQPVPKLGAWVDVLVEILEKEAKLPRRERRSMQRLFEELRGRGYDGAHDSVHRFTKSWRDGQARTPTHAFVPLSFALGEAYQFDWSHKTITPQGLPLAIKAAHMKLSYSRMPFVRAYFRETQELVFDAHDKAFEFYGGICRRGICDNMKTAVEAIFVGKARQYNRRFLQMCSHHLVEPVAFTPASGWEKEQVENQVGKTRSDRMRAKLQDIKAELRRRMHQPIPMQGHWLKQIVVGHFASYAVPTNSRALDTFRYHVTNLWRRTVRRRNQKHGCTRDRITKITDAWLPKPRILHPWPNVRFAVRQLR